LLIEENKEEVKEIGDVEVKDLGDIQPIEHHTQPSSNSGDLLCEGNEQDKK